MQDTRSRLGLALAMLWLGMAVPAAAQPVQSCPSKAPAPMTVTCNGTGPGYPYDISEVRRSILYAQAFMDAAARENQLVEEDGPRRGHGVVAIVDTGLVGIAGVDIDKPETFPAKVPVDFFEVYATTVGSTDDVRTFGQILADVTGLPSQSPLDATAPSAIPEQPHHEHGTHVAGIVLGQGQLGANRDALLKKKLKIAAFNVVNFKRGRNASGCGGEYIVDTKLVTDALRIVGEQVAGDTTPVINMSFETRSIISLPSSEGELIKGENSIYVVAAGNSPVNHDQRTEKIYPARLVGSPAGERFPYMIVVGAHDADGNLVPGTAFGKWTVDLAAPGCEIPSMMDLRSGSVAKMSGTSQATAFVSLTAALLKGLYDMDPDDVRIRINDTVDRVPALEKLTASGGRLNIGKAVAAAFDVVKLKSGEMLLGRMRDEALSFCEATIAQLGIPADHVGREDFRRIDLKHDAAGPNSTIVLSTASVREAFSCPKDRLENAFVNFAAYGDTGKLGPDRAFKLTEVAEIIPTQIEIAQKFHDKFGDIGPIAVEVGDVGLRSILAALENDARPASR